MCVVHSETTPTKSYLYIFKYLKTGILSNLPSPHFPVPNTLNHSLWLLISFKVLERRLQLQYVFLFHTILSTVTLMGWGVNKYEWIPMCPMTVQCVHLDVSKSLQLNSKTDIKIFLSNMALSWDCLSISVSNIASSNPSTPLHPPLPTPWSQLPFAPSKYFISLLHELAGLWDLPICPPHSSQSDFFQHKYDYVTLLLKNPSVTSRCLKARQNP